MRKFDKLNNLKKANLLSEERYLDNKKTVGEDWKSTAAGIGMALGSLSCANAQSVQPKDSAQQQMVQVTKDVCQLVYEGGLDLGVKLIELYKKNPQALAKLEQDPEFKRIARVVRKYSKVVDENQGYVYYDAHIADYVDIPIDMTTRLGDRFAGRDITKDFIIAMENNAASM